MDSGNKRRVTAQGFTLVELMIVIVIIIVLAVVVVGGVRRLMENSRKVQAMAQFRDFQVGMTLFEGDYQRPPIPSEKRNTGWDTVYGDTGGKYENKYLVAVLAGEDKDYPFEGRNFSTMEPNPRGESYMTFPFSPDNKKGVGKDGNLYDPWGRQVLVAVNSLNSPNADLVDSNSGQNDRLLNTWGFAEYKETKPKDQSYVFWSYGKDKKKGRNAPSEQAVVPLKGSDDVISW